MTVVCVQLTRSELTALVETIDVTPSFEGRIQTREAIREVIRSREAFPPPLCIDETHLAALAGTIIALDYRTSALRHKLGRALESQRSTEP